MTLQDTGIDPDNIKKAFKAYDVRGRIPEELNDEIVKRIGNAFAQFLAPNKEPIFIGYDVRPSSQKFSQALSEGICDAGLDVINIGLVGTDMVYFATGKFNCSGGVMITASHNPANYNGLKFVKKDAVAISGDSGLKQIRDLVIEGSYVKTRQRGSITSKNVLDEYVQHVLSFVEIEKINPMKVVMNAGNGCAGVVLEKLVTYIPQITPVQVFWEPDGSFPNGIPNPLLPDRREDTAKKVREHKADLGVAWDGDFDRCFFYDNTGEFVEGYYIVALFAEFFSKKFPGSKIIHDPRLTWATIESVKKSGGIPVLSKAGHAFIKERMRKEDAIYAGEMSAHHYFRDNFYADNGMIPLLLLLQIMSEKEKSLRELVEEWVEKYPVSGEINIKVNHPDNILKSIKEEYQKGAKFIDHTDGLSIEYEYWRFNLRKSNTEPVIRLNVETRGNYKLMEEKRDELISKIKTYDK